MLSRLRGIALLTAAALLAAGGCAMRRTYAMEVVNDASVPLCAGFVKTAPPVEDQFSGPEDVAIHAPQFMDRHWGQLIPPGGRSLIGPSRGVFPRGVEATLRIYAGDRSLGDLVAYGRDDPDRLDILVGPGHGAVIVTDRKGQLTAEPAVPTLPLPRR